MKLGDVVTLTTIWGTFTYKVVDFEIVLPTDLSAVSIQPGKDLVTLSTCHPYPYNSHRYLVICERTADTEGVGVVPDFSSGLGGLLGLGLVRSNEGPLLDDGSINAIFFENSGRLVGRVLLVVLVVWAVWGAVCALSRKGS